MEEHIERSLRRRFNSGAKTLIEKTGFTGAAHLLTRDTNFKELGMVAGGLALPLADAYITLYNNNMPPVMNYVPMAAYTIVNFPLNVIEAVAGGWIGKEIGRSIDNKIEKFKQRKRTNPYRFEDSLLK